MKFDEYGLIEMQQSGWPGSIGDSAAETFRFFHLVDDERLTRETVRAAADKITTATGYVRHPTAPAGWRESDFSGDQALPLYLALDWYCLGKERRQLEERIKDAGWKTGNGDFISLLFITAVRRADGKASWFSDLPLLLEAIELRLFESGDSQSGNWLNTFHVLLQSHRKQPTWVSRLAGRLLPGRLVLEKIEAYYRPEPDSDWVINSYKRVSD